MIEYSNISRIEIITRPDNGLLVYYENIRGRKNFIGIITCKTWAKICENHLEWKLQKNKSILYTIEPIGCTCIFFPKVERFWHKVNSLEDVGEIFK